MKCRITNDHSVNRRPPTCHTWIDSQECDAETLVEITREMSDFFERNSWELDDSRCFYRLCIDMTIDFQRIHVNSDWDKCDFLSAIITYAENIKRKLSENPTWINTDYKWMYGNETITDLS